MSRIITVLSLTWGLVVLPCVGLADEGSPIVICKLKGAVRTIEVKQADQGCQTLYSKGGSSSKMGEGKFAKSCLHLVDNIRGNLEAADWKCRAAAVKAIELSESNERTL